LHMPLGGRPERHATVDGVRVGVVHRDHEPQRRCPTTAQ
jgi:hypothetical protein